VAPQGRIYLVQQTLVYLLRLEFLELEVAVIAVIRITRYQLQYPVAAEQTGVAFQLAHQTVPVLAHPCDMEHVAVDTVVAADVVGQRLGTILRERHVVRLAAFGRSVAGNVNARYLYVVVLLHQPYGVGYGVELGPVVLITGNNPVAVLAELESRGT